MQAMNWDVNAAVDLFLENEGTQLGVMPETAVGYQVKEPDEDDGEDDDGGFRGRGEEIREQQRRASAAPPGSFPIGSFLSGMFPRVGSESFMASAFGDPWVLNQSRPRNVRDIPIMGDDDDDNGAVGGLKISEIPVEEAEMMEARENDPSQAGGSRVESMGGIGGTGAKPAEGKASGLGERGPVVDTGDEDKPDLLGGYMDPDLQDTEEHMIRAAIEESRKAALQSGGNNEELTRSFSSLNGDEDLERAMSLSLQTAEQERRNRERQVDSDGQDPLLHDEDGDEDPPGGLVRRTVHREETRRSTRISETTVHPGGEGPRMRSLVVERGSIGGNRRARGRGVGEAGSNIGPVRSGGVSSSGGGGNSTPGRRRGGPSTRKSAGGSGRRGCAPLDAEGEGGLRDLEGDISRDVGRAAGGRGVLGRGGPNGPRGDTGGATGRNESGAGLMDAPEDDVMADAENGHEESLGLSSAERAEAVMLESALFGVPYRGASVETGGSASRRPPVNSQIPSTFDDDRQLREEQDTAFAASLQADREKEMERQRRREEIEALERAEEESRREEGRAMQQAAEELERELERKRLDLPPEPENGDSSAIYLMVRLPDGSRRGRRFRRQDKLQALYDFIDVSGGVKPGSYRLAQTFPKRLISNGNAGISLEEAGLLNRQETLFLEWL
ncbi:hypothetical protein CBR_g50340 [Chara braunii]|uniref:UBX domain-containing protein n=1 Tax=Chara braunii TaxID=69332 RepID=A0A388K5K4_CHABU|nr:hypothetical protein CBR_g50340 [Chara braunii]|eukprot:GBG65299.1 hypothetical protein CBR_g50340 [Chara braunii]